MMPLYRVTLRLPSISWELEAESKEDAIAIAKDLLEQSMASSTWEDPLDQGEWSASVNGRSDGNG